MLNPKGYHIGCLSLRYLRSCRYGCLRQPLSSPFGWGMGAQIPQLQALSIVLSVFLLLHINSPDMHRGPLHLQRRSCWQAKWKSFLWLHWSSSRTRCRWPQALGPHGPSRELDQLKNRWDASLEMGSNWVNGWASGWAVWNFLQNGSKGPDLSNQDFWQNTWKLIPFCWWPAGSILSGPVIQANGRLTFEDDLRSGGLLCFTTQWTSNPNGLADSMVTLEEPGDG